FARFGTFGCFKLPTVHVSVSSPRPGTDTVMLILTLDEVTSRLPWKFAKSMPTIVPLALKAPERPELLTVIVVSAWAPKTSGSPTSKPKWLVSWKLPKESIDPHRLVLTM